jgi:hypothetical protein
MGWGLKSEETGVCLILIVFVLSSRWGLKSGKTGGCFIFFIFVLSSRWGKHLFPARRVALIEESVVDPKAR